MVKVKTILFYCIQIALILLSGYMAYVPTLRVDFFSWGSSKVDGLYLLVVPIMLLPSILLFSFLKFLLLRRTNEPMLVGLSFVVSAFVSFLITIIVALSDSNEGMFIATLLSFFLTVFYIVEAFIFFRKHRNMFIVH
jgi:drug/metabolite transporter (DMT)-like permease